MSEANVRADDNYIFVPGQSEAFNADLALAFAQLVTHGHGGTFRLTRRAMEELRGAKITRIRDEVTGNIIFRVEAEQ